MQADADMWPRGKIKLKINQEISLIYIYTYEVKLNSGIWSSSKKKTKKTKKHPEALQSDEGAE